MQNEVKVHNNSAPQVNDRSVDQAFSHLIKRRGEFSKNRPARIIDMGTGEGYNAWKLREKLVEAGVPYKIVCVDIEPELFMLPKDAGIEFVEFNLEREQHFGIFDVVMATEVIEHVENPYHFLRSCLDHCDKKGVLVVSTPNVANLYSAIKIALTGVPSMFNFAFLKLGYQAHIMPMSPFLMRLALNKIGIERKISYDCAVTYNRNVLLLPIRIAGRRAIKIPGYSRIFGEVGIYSITEHSRE